jgi:hypothetical protein
VGILLLPFTAACGWLGAIEGDSLVSCSSTDSEGSPDINTRLFLPSAGPPLTTDFELWGQSTSGKGRAITDVKVLGQKATPTGPDFRGWKIALTHEQLAAIADESGRVEFSIIAWDSCGESATYDCETNPDACSIVVGEPSTTEGDDTGT